MIKFVVLAVSLIAFREVAGHGMLLDPPNRSSLWRFDDDAPINYNDNENFCGGINVQWNENGGKCGVCGDNYVSAHPQDNENTGTYGQGKIVANYTSGQIITTNARLTANHLGYFEYSLCELKDTSTWESGEECFEPLLFADGSSTFEIVKEDREVYNELQLPRGFKCNHCVLRWSYRGGNNWGTCEDGSVGMGCGPQETFRSCADVAIL